MLIACASLICLVIGYFIGFERGIYFCVGNESRRKAFPDVAPLLRSMTRRERRKPKSISEHELWTREQKTITPADPGEE